MLEAMLKDICGSDLFNSVYEVLSKNWFESGNAVMNVVQQIHSNIIMPVALMLTFLYFMIAVVDKLSGENFTWEQLWRQMAMLLAAKYLIEHGFEILQILYNIGLSLLGDINNYNQTINNSAIDAKAMLDSFEQSFGIDGFSIKIINKLVMFLYLIIPWLFSWIMRLCVYVICYSRVIEIYARAAFAPIAISDFFHSGLQGGGWRFLKNFLAVSLQGGMILLITIIFSKLFSTVVTADTNMFTYIGKYLSFTAAALMLMFKSLSLTKELVGTN